MPHHARLACCTSVDTPNYIITINNMLIVQYPMQFSGPPEILAIHVQHRFVQAHGSSTNTNRVHALLLPSKHY